MNLLMILLIVLGLWVGVAVCYFAWRLMVGAEAEVPVSRNPDAEIGPEPARKAEADAEEP